MNIDQAKIEVKNAVRAYLEKDELGQYEIPTERQRPILLMGPPGIGKTAVMEQIAHELKIGLVSYTITHHTRQSAIGLPKISEKSFGGKEYSVTEYTMSEIIGAVYEQIEKTGIREGILFLDEINCVSETLAPTMLQFLQYKTFGSHKLPSGYIIVTAGNPLKYNKSVREFDIVTLDRVRQINIEEDFDAWKDYAYKAAVHGSILAYLEIKKDNFYSIKTEINGRSFVTARGWEDLSRIIKVYEKLGIEVNESLTSQYLQNREIARDFADYYELYRRYNELYKIPDILEGRFPEDKDALRKGSFDEKLSIIGLLTDKLMEEFREYASAQAVQKGLFEAIKEVGEKSVNEGTSEGKSFASLFDEKKAELSDKLLSDVEAGLVSREDEKIRRRVLSVLDEFTSELGETKPVTEKVSQTSAAASFVENKTSKNANMFENAKALFASKESLRQAKIKAIGEHLTNSFAFIEETFGDGEALSGSQEMVIFLTELSSAYYSLKFVRETNNEAYYKYNKLLLLDDRQKELRDMVEKLVF